LRQQRFARDRAAAADVVVGVVVVVDQLLDDAAGRAQRAARALSGDLKLQSY